MNKIKVRMFGTLKGYLGWSEKNFSINEISNISKLLNIIFKKQKENGKKQIFSQYSLDNPLFNALILVNGIEINNIKGLETPIYDGDILDFLSIIHGG